MKNVIHKIFSGEVDAEVHTDFVKFSKGRFENRYIIEGKKQKDKWAVKTSAEFANYFVRRGMEKSNDEVAVKGIIVCTHDIRSEFSFEVANVKSYMGIKQFVLDTSVKPEEILGLMEKYPRVFYALSFSVGDFQLKVKAKPPKSGKPGKKGDDEGPKAEFCSLKTSDKDLVKDLFFDFPDFKEVKINHAIEVTDIEIPKDYKTPEEMREKAVRKGVVYRAVTIDGLKKESEKAFSA